MTDDDKPKRPKRRPLSDIERVEMLYKLSDRLQGGFAEPKPPSPSKFTAADPEAEAGDSANGSDESSEGVSDVPFWILQVLEDLSDFASGNNYSDLENCLEDARRRVAKILDDMDDT